MTTAALWRWLVKQFTKLLTTELPLWKSYKGQERGLQGRATGERGSLKPGVLTEWTLGDTVREEGQIKGAAMPAEALGWEAGCLLGDQEEEACGARV